MTLDPMILQFALDLGIHASRKGQCDDVDRMPSFPVDGCHLKLSSSKE